MDKTTSRGHIQATVMTDWVFKHEKKGVMVGGLIFIISYSPCVSALGLLLLSCN